MATVAAPAEQATDLLQKLSLDSQTKTLEVPEATKKPNSIPYGPADASDVSAGPILPYDRSTTPLLQDFMDPSMCYIPNGYASTAYYYGGYDGPINDWEEYPRYVGPDGVEMPPGVYGDNGSLMYHPGYGYPPYGPYPHAGSPVPTMGLDGQLYGPQHFQYGAHYYQQPAPPSAQYTPNQVSAPQAEISTSVAPDQVTLPVELANGNSNGVANGNTNGSNGTVPLRPNYSNSMLATNGSYGRGVLPGGIPGSGYQDPRFGFDGMRSPVPWLDGPIFSDGQPRPATSSSVSSTVSHVNTIPSARNQNLRGLPHLMGPHPPRPNSSMGPSPGFMNRMYPNNRMYGQAANTLRTSPGYGSNGYDSRANARGWLAVDSKYKPRGRGNGFFGYGNENMDVLNEQNRGPRAARFKNQRGFTPSITLAVKGQNIPANLNNEDGNTIPDRDLYNRAEFPIKYSDAKFFVIKSYSEDDIHKSIKYSVWASTPNGNKKLDAGYQEAQDKSDACPVFLFFSVNTSGQFVGLAEMVGPVDFNKNVEYWQQDKWNGCFPVKWHIVKDVPNSLLKHITLENNDNKPVTNSRDTQEVKFEQGLEMLKIFKEYVSKTCILDDFGFYEGRQKTIQENRAKQQQQQQQLQKQVWDGKGGDATVDDKDVANSKPRLQKPSEVKEAPQGLGERKQSEENGMVTGTGDVPKGAKPVTEKRVPNGIANGC